MKQRNIAYDYLRAIAILLVGILHAWSLLKMDEPQYGIMCYVYRAIVNVGVPLFVLISGALVLGGPTYSIPDFLKKRLIRVLIPFLIWATIIYVFSVSQHQYNEIQTIQDALLCWIPYLLNNQINVSHWFIHMIVILYLLTPLLQRIIQSAYGKELCEYMLIMIGIGLILKWFAPQVYILNYCTNLLGSIGVYVAGYYVSKYGLRFPAAPWVYGIATVVLYGINVLTNCPNNLLTLLTATSIFGMILSLHQSIQLPSCRFVIAISRFSYLTYLVHIPIICAIYLLAHIETSQSWIPLVVGIGVVVICTLGGWIVDRIPGKWKLYIGIAG